ncbi:helix-turn-helix transcriptional regulator [Amycolatopsis sp. NPDC005232]|uniref:PadR family transcriptional regulator n=1 Tax=Amycolatopsis sp. NPDC005232 TaxID=3157027 RepID=UPI00339E427C
MSATRLLVLGVVRMFGRAHGYQVRRELLTWSAEKWANVQPGSIYHALKKMTAENLLEKVDVEPGDSGPDRVAYRLTDDGEQEFQLLLTRALSDPEVGHPEMSAGIGLMPALPRQHAISLLRQRLVHLEGEERRARLMLDDQADWGQPAHVVELFRLWAGISGASHTWLENLIERLEKGEYVMADDDEPLFRKPSE